MPNLRCSLRAKNNFTAVSLFNTVCENKNTIKRILLSSIIMVTFFFLFSTTTNAQDCYPNCSSPWTQTCEEITLPEFPNCRLEFCYYYRNCTRPDGTQEFQIKPNSLTPNPYTPRECQDYIRYISITDPYNQALFHSRLDDALFSAWKVIMGKRFDEGLAIVPPHLWSTMFGCDRPPQPTDIDWVYFKGRCISYCFATYMFGGVNTAKFTVDLCDHLSEGCCTYTIRFCWNAAKNKIDTILTSSTTQSIVCPSYIPEGGPYSCQPPEGAYNVNIIRTACGPSCNRDIVYSQKELETQIAYEKEYEFEINPNPTTDILNVTFIKVYKLQIMDNEGKICMEMDIDFKDTEAKIDVSKLAKGVYYVMITDDRHWVRSKQFIKN